MPGGNNRSRKDDAEKLTESSEPRVTPDVSENEEEFELNATETEGSPNHSIQDPTTGFQSVCDQLKVENHSLRAELDIVKAVVAKQHEQITQLQKAMLDQQKRSMEDNILFHGLPESQGENLEDIVRKISVKMHGYFSAFGVEKIHRLGPPASSTDSRKPRPIVALLTVGSHDLS